MDRKLLYEQVLGNTMDRQLLSVAMNQEWAELAALVSEGADVHVTDGPTALHYAVYYCHFPSCLLLLKKGAEIDAKDKSGETPLHIGADRGSPPVCELLIRMGAEVNAKNKDGKTPLHKAAEKNHLSTCELLVNKGAEVDAKDKDGWTPLFQAADLGHHSVCELLLSKGADVNTKDKDGETPLHNAAFKGHLSTCEFLVSQGANKNAKNNSGKTPLGTARDYDEPAVAKFLRSKSALASVPNARPPYKVPPTSTESSVTATSPQVPSPVKAPALTKPFTSSPPPSSRLDVLTAQAAFVSAITQGSSVPWHRSKLMLVGEGRAGKSSTVRSFLNQPFDANIASTRGANTEESCTVQRNENVVDWTEHQGGNEFREMAARATAQKMLNKQTENLPTSAVLGSAESVETAQPPQPARRASFTQRVVSSVRKMSLTSAPKPSTSSRDLPTPPPEADVAKQFDADLVADALDAEKSTQSKLKLSIWDYGGQRVFYALHHIFLTRFGVYVLVFDMSRVLNPETQEESLDMLRFWLRSVEMHAKEAPVFLVGTHKDKVPSETRHEQINHLLVDRLGVSTNSQIRKNKRAAPQKSLWFFPIDNSKGAAGDPVIPQLRAAILDAVKDESYVQLAVPILWMRVLDALLEQRKEHPFLSVEDVTKQAESLGVARSQVRQMLVFFNELGVLVFFDSAVDLRRWVILNPQWLVDRLTKVIRDFRHHEYDEVEMDAPLLAKFAGDLRFMMQRGIVTRALLNALWRDTPQEVVEFLISLTKKMDLMCTWVQDDSSEERYLIPSLFEWNDSLSTLPGVMRDDREPVATFDLSFAKFFLPIGLFTRLVALVATHAHAAFEDSAVPLLTKGHAQVSFGLADFVIDERVDLQAIRVGVLSKQDAPKILELLVSMVDKLREETMGQALVVEVHLLAQTDTGALVPVPNDIVAKALKEKRERVRATNNVPVDPKNLGFFFEQVAAPTVQHTLSPVQPGMYHVMISYSQQTGQLAKVLHLLLTGRGYVVWYDQDFPENLSEAAMMEGVRNSNCLVLFLTAGVLTRPFCIAEVRLALALNKPILLVHEEDLRFTNGVTFFYDMRDEAPEDLRPLFKEVESLPFRRRKFEEEAMIVELGRRIQKCCAGE